jgi:hypothetical protein
LLQPAILHENQLKQKFTEIMLDEEFMFMFGCSYRDELIIERSTWNKHQFVSVNANGEVIGYFKYNIDRDALNCNGLQVVNFYKDKICKHFINDLDQMIRDVFVKFKFRKLKFAVHIGNPAEKFYDKHLHKIGGRVVGIYLKEDKMMDGNYYDYKMYEVMREDYLKVNKI